jgi:hypothetical protein
MAENNRTMRDIAEQGRKDGAVMTEIAKDAKRDSFAMKTISVVTMYYLPGAFVSVSVCSCQRD